MSNKKKIKAQKVASAPKGGKKPSFWSKAWPKIRFFLKTLYSNDACVEGRKAKWYGPLIVAFLAIVISLIPTMVSGFSQSGGVILDNPTHGLDVSLTEFSRELDARGIELVVENGKLIDKDGKWEENYGDATPSAYLHSYVHHVVDIPAAEEGSSEPTTPTYSEVITYDFAVYYIGDHAKTAAQYAAENVLDRESYSIEGGGTYNPKTTTFMVMSETDFVLYKGPNYDPATANSILGSVSGSWNSAALEGVSLAKLANQGISGGAYVNSYESNPRAYVNEVRESWKTLFHDGAAHAIMLNALSMLGITAAIFVALTFILGLTVFLMTRGKRNPFNTYSFWDGQKIAYWASFTPALLGMILSFIIPSWAILFFIFLFGMRIMWMSMKSLRPQYGQ